MNPLQIRLCSYSLLRTILEKNLTVKRHIGRPRMRWGNEIVGNDVEELGGGTDWKARANYQDGWKAECMMERS